MGHLKRKVIKKEENRVIHLFSEGVTERIYFDNFKKWRSGVIIKPESLKVDPLTMLRKIKQKSIDKNDIVYCIFDVNGNDDSTLKKAKEEAKKNKINTCISNPCFEIWYLLHCQECNLVFSCCDDLLKMLNKHISTYTKTENIYPKIKTTEDMAIKRAKSLKKAHLDSDVDLYSRRGSPLTEAFEIVELLNEKMKLK